MKLRFFIWNWSAQRCLPNSNQGQKYRLCNSSSFMPVGLLVTLLFERQLGWWERKNQLGFYLETIISHSVIDSTAKFQLNCRQKFEYSGIRCRCRGRYYMFPHYHRPIDTHILPRSKNQFWATSSSKIDSQFHCPVDCIELLVFVNSILSRDMISN